MDIRHLRNAHKAHVYKAQDVIDGRAGDMEGSENQNLISSVESPDFSSHSLKQIAQCSSHVME
jgi:hypothetical protein